MTIATLLTVATQRLTNAGIPPDEARTEARLLVQHAFGRTREQLILRPDTQLDAERLEPFLARRANREPLAYIIGERGFYGLSFQVTPAVLIPRPETEHLVEVVLEFLPPPARLGSPPPPASRRGAVSPPSPPSQRGTSDQPEGVTEWCEVGGGEKRGERLLDIGTGSGCIAVTLAKLLPEAQVWATDISEAALDVARGNAARHGVSVEFRLGDLLAPLRPELRFEVIVSNPPYIAPTDAPTLAPEVHDFEPHTALFDPSAGGDGLSFYRRLATEAPARLVAGGLLAVEVGQGQAEAVAQLWRDAGLTEVTVTPDLAGIGRVVSGRKP